MDGARAAAQAPPWCIKIASGESGIRTHGAASGSTVFETARFDRSRISPSARTARARLRTRMYKQTRIQPRMGRGRRSTVTYQSRPSSTDGARSLRAWTHRRRPSSHGRSEVVACMDAQATTELHGRSEGLQNNARSSPRIITREATELFVPKRIRTSDL